jgi:hypothetical protein
MRYVTHSQGIRDVIAKRQGAKQSLSGKVCTSGDSFPLFSCLGNCVDAGSDITTWIVDGSPGASCES